MHNLGNFCKVFLVNASNLKLDLMTCDKRSTDYIITWRVHAH
jgi:hypothetical protein